MKALIVGYGSMGRRRARLIRKIKSETEIIIVEAREDRRIQAKADKIKVYENLTSAIAENPSVAFICTSPQYHISIAIQLVNKGISVFLELNLNSDGYEELSRDAQANNVTVFMSSTLLYDRAVQIIKNKVRHVSKPLIYTYHVGQYLPDWHPWESYKDFFVSEKSTNAIREILAIQLPWIISAFGEVEEVNAKKVKCTCLEIDFNDGVIVNVLHKNGTIGSLVIDVVSRKPVTALEIIGEELYLCWHGHSDDLYELNLSTKEMEQLGSYEFEEHEALYADNIIENRYADEISAFFEAVFNGNEPKYSLDEDKYVLSVIDKIEKAE